MFPHQTSRRPQRHGPNPNPAPEDSPSNSPGHRDTPPVGEDKQRVMNTAATRIRELASGGRRKRRRDLFVGRRRVGSEDVVLDTGFPQPQREGTLYENWLVGLMLGQELHLVRTLDAWTQTGSLRGWNLQESRPNARGIEADIYRLCAGE